MIRVIAMATVCALLAMAGCSNASPPPSPPESTAMISSSIAQTAVSAVGVQYRYGGTSPHKGFDCSGLVWWAHDQNGLAVPRSTANLAAAGRAVPLEGVSPGDVLIFDTGSGLHAGVALDGSRFVHSPKSGDRVQVEVWDEGYWDGRLVTIRRFP